MPPAAGGPGPLQPVGMAPNRSLLATGRMPRSLASGLMAVRLVSPPPDVPIQPDSGQVRPYGSSGWGGRHHPTGDGSRGQPRSVDASDLMRRLKASGVWLAQSRGLP